MPTYPAWETTAPFCLDAVSFARMRPPRGESMHCRTTCEAGLLPVGVYSAAARARSVREQASARHT